MMTTPTQTQTAILVVEDDAAARMVTAATLEEAGYSVMTASDGETALNLLNECTFAVVISDIRMRVVDGIGVLQAARNQSYQPAVILLTGYGSVDTAVAALRTGAYDYLLKPCDPQLLIERVERAMRYRSDQIKQADTIRAIAQIAAQIHEPGTEPAPAAAPAATAQQSRRYLRVGDLVLDLFRHEVSLNGQSIHVTRIEYELLRCLADADGRVLNYQEIVRHTHGHDIDDSEALLLLKQHIRNVRRKIPAEYLVNVRGTGYALVDPKETQPAM
jgi:DNA-binding response OmpR family regulator